MRGGVCNPVGFAGGNPRGIHEDPRGGGGKNASQSGSTGLDR